MPLTGDGVDLRIPLLGKAGRICPQRAGDRPKPPDGALRTDAPYLQAFFRSTTTRLSARFSVPSVLSVSW